MTRPRESHGRIFCATCCWRAAMNRKTSTSGSGWTPGRSNKRRTASPSRVLSRSQVRWSFGRCLRSHRSSRTIWVVLPDPSTPSSVMSNPLTLPKPPGATIARAFARFRGNAPRSFLEDGVRVPAGTSTTARLEVTDRVLSCGLALAAASAVQDLAGQVPAAEAEGQGERGHDAAEKGAEGDEDHVAADRSEE